MSSLVIEKSLLAPPGLTARSNRAWRPRRFARAPLPVPMDAALKYGVALVSTSTFRTIYLSPQYFHENSSLGFPASPESYPCPRAV